jgi:hypothetical protein
VYEVTVILPPWVLTVRVIVFAIAVTLNGRDIVAFVPLGTNVDEYQLDAPTASCTNRFDVAPVTTRRTAPVTIQGPDELSDRVILCGLEKVDPEISNVACVGVELQHPFPDPNIHSTVEDG